MVSCEVKNMPREVKEIRVSTGISGVTRHESEDGAYKLMLTLRIIDDKYIAREFSNRVFAMDNNIAKFEIRAQTKDRSHTGHFFQIKLKKVDDLRGLLNKSPFSAEDVERVSYKEKTTDFRNSKKMEMISKAQEIINNLSKNR